LKIYTFFSESHASLFELFQKSLVETNPNLEIVVDKLDQFGSGIFMQNGWLESMSKKLDQIIRACEQEDIFIHADSDIYFFNNIEKDLLDELGEFDLAFQDDGHVGLCMGFFVCRPSKKVYNLFCEVKRRLDQFNGHDQNALNMLIKETDVKYKRLPHRYSNYGQKHGKVWDGSDFEVDQDILILHANWVIGIENKIKLINYVKQKIREK